MNARPLLRAAALAGSAAVVLAAALAARQCARSFPAAADPARALRPSGPSAEGSSAGGPSADGFPPDVVRLDERLEPIRARHGAPALACAIVRGDRLHALGAVGARRAGRPERVTWNDRFHIGSDTKAITATLAARLVEEGRLRWDATLAELFPDLAGAMRPEYRAVTLDMLLRHESGLPPDGGDVALFERLRALAGTPREQRRAAVRVALERAPAFPPGTRCAYANLNFTLVGAAIERATGDDWEAQVRRRIFEPLGMRDAGFGSPSSPGALDQPWGHALFAGWPARLFWRERTLLPAAGAPAGNVSLSLSDWARFASLHLGGARGRCRLLSCASFEHLQREGIPGSGFACGWGVAPDDAGRKALQHVGSEGWWFAIAVLTPDLDEAVLTATNVGGERGEQACLDALALARALRRGEWRQAGRQEAPGRTP